MSPFSAPFFWGTQKREAAAPKASGCFMGGTCVVREEPGKQKPRSCRAQELARSSAQENVGQKKGWLIEPGEIVWLAKTRQRRLRREVRSQPSSLARTGNQCHNQIPNTN
jgi:hypothetical protein